MHTPNQETNSAPPRGDGATIDPESLYETRLAERREELERLRRRENALANARLAVFAAAVAIFAYAFYSELYHWAWVGAPLAGYVLLAILHARVMNKGPQAEARIRFYEQGLARLRGQWRGQNRDTPPGVEEGSEHPYARDLDLFGHGSLFQLLNTAVTSFGETCLGDWLREAGTREDGPFHRDAITARQEAVQDFTSWLDLRETLAAATATEDRGRNTADELAQWGGQAAVTIPAWARAAGYVFFFTGLLSVVGLLYWNWGPLPLLGTAAVCWGVQKGMRARVDQVDQALNRRARGLRRLAAVLWHFEQAQVECGRLAALRERLMPDGEPVSAEVRRLHHRVELLEMRNNPMFMIPAFFMLWRLQLCHAIEQWRRRHGPHIEDWTDALGELEGLLALGGFAFEHPAYAYPEFHGAADAAQETGGKDALLELEEAGHPLLSPGQCVPNTVRLGPATRLMVVSGSNMSGKSTLLRTVGVNVVLAQMGAPVCCRAMRLNPVLIGATLRVEDSIQEGVSRFYAEIRRLSRLMEMTRSDRPLLFLLDELLHGTNSHDRVQGAQALLKRFLERGALGLVTTHDLALTRLEHEMRRCANVHFQDRVENGRIEFDYKMRPGVVEKSNALALMRSVGLDI
ncbi:MAG: DNA mismatch repair protein MutS [Candidatus Hydrogenedentota bacterium]